MSWTRLCRLWLCVLGIILGLTIEPRVHAQGDAQQQLLELTFQTLQQVNAGQIAEAEKSAAKLQALADRAFQNQPANRATVLLQVFIVKSTAGKYDEAERLGKQVLALFESLPGQEIGLAVTHGKLGGLYLDLGRFAEAQKHYERSYTIARDAKLPEHPMLSIAAMNRATIYNYQSRYADGEAWSTYGLQLLKKHLPEDDPQVQQALGILAHALEGQNRNREAEQLHRQALAVLEKKFGKGDSQTARALQDLGMFYLLRHRSAEATEYLTRSLQAYEKQTPDSLAAADVMFFLAALLLTEENDAETANRYFQRSKTIATKMLGPNNSFSTMSRMFEGGQGLHQVMRTPNLTPEELRPRLEKSLAMLRQAFDEEVRQHGTDSPNILSQVLLQTEMLLMLESVARKSGGQDAVAKTNQDGPLEQMLELAGKIVQSHPNSPLVQSNLAGFYETKGRLEWNRQRRTSAVELLKKSMSLVDEKSSTLSGNENDQARYLTKIVGPFHRMVEWQSELGPDADIAEAFETAERARARTLLVQLDLKGVDLLRKLPDAEAAPLHKRLVDSQSRVLELQNRITRMASRTDLSATVKDRQTGELTRELSAAQEEFVNANRDIRNASPDYRLAMQQSRQTLTWTQLQSQLQTQSALLLQYVITESGTYLIAADADGRSAVHELKLSDEQCRELNLTRKGFSEQLHDLLQGRGEQSLLASLRQPEPSDKATGILATLWTALIPDSIRAAIQAEKYRLLIVIPDGELSLLPFECLVVEKGAAPRYLLDVGPPVVYAPSATVLASLAERPAGSSRSGRAPILTLGNPTYSGSGVPDSNDLLASLSSRGTFRSVGGRLASLPFSGTESTWVEQTFRKAGLAVDSLRGPAATEAAIRSQASGRKIIHLACHGLTDQAHGNLFGALAVTPGSNTSLPSDDGFLTLAELYELDLRDSELAILSACDTNFGPQQRGEGAWALTRGFLVAGARRVAASNWLVDDEAAASLVSYFAGGIARDLGQSAQPDYAKRLHDAKRWVRQQDKWKSPYYWGGFVLVGPN